MKSLFIIESNDYDLHEFGGVLQSPPNADAIAMRDEFLAHYGIPGGDDQHWPSDEPEKKSAHEQYQTAAFSAAKKLSSEGFKHPYHTSWPTHLSSQRDWMPAFVWWLVNHKGFVRLAVQRFDFNAASDSPYCLTAE